MRLEPRSTAPVLAVVGGGETAEFFRQADELAAAWSTSATTVERYDEPEVDHFDLVERLADPDSELFRRVCAWLV